MVKHELAFGANTTGGGRIAKKRFAGWQPCLPRRLRTLRDVNLVSNWSGIAGLLIEVIYKRARFTLLPRMRVVLDSAEALEAGDRSSGLGKRMAESHRSLRDL